MSSSAVTTFRASRAAWSQDLGLALIATLIALAVDAMSGFKTLHDAADNDSLLRLVEIRDLLAGQGWFDLHQYRMGVDGGFVMHWSRLVDAPIAAIILAASAFTGSIAGGEMAARILWPALMLCLSVFFLARAARRYGGDSAVLPAVIAGGGALHFLGIFSPNALDHHNIQLMLTLASLSFLLAAPQQKAAAAFSGICAALTLAIGMETAPYVAVIGLCVAGLFLFGGQGERSVARQYGLGFAGTALTVFVSTIPFADWGQARCDAFSSVQFVLAALGGTGLAVAASFDAACRTPMRRAMALAVLGAGLAAITLRWFPQCLAAPYAGLDPRLHEYWLDHISEAQSMFQLIQARDSSVLARYVTPIIAIAIMAARLRQGAWRRQDSLVGALLVASFVVSIWQVRGSTFSIALAVIALSGWIASWRERALATPTPAVSLKMIAVWLVSMNAFWTVASAMIADDPSATGAPVAGKPAMADCKADKDFSILATQPDSTVLATSNLGAPVLAYSGHRALSGPYHRNIAGNLLVLDAYMGTIAEAKTVIDRNKVGLVALCPGSPENKLLVDGAPGGFLAQLLRGAIPAWLEPVAGAQDGPLQLYRVKQG